MIGDFGAIMQLGYIVPSIEGAVPQWTALGIGPFFGGGAFAMDDYVYRGVRGACRLKVAIAYWGEVQVELLEPVGDERTFYRDAVRDAPGELNHYGIIVADVDATIARGGFGDRIVQHGRTIAGRFAYLDGLLPGGLLLELIEDSAVIRRSNAFISDAARSWDGAHPLRSNAALIRALAG